MDFSSLPNPFLLSDSTKKLLQSSEAVKTNDLLTTMVNKELPKVNEVLSMVDDELTGIDVPIEDEELPKVNEVSMGEEEQWTVDREPMVDKEQWTVDRVSIVDEEQWTTVNRVPMVDEELPPINGVSKWDEELKVDRVSVAPQYWYKRYQLFTRYDEGIKLDEESWFSVTPEDVAAHIAERCSTDGIVIDAFCGCGGNTIQFAKRAVKVIAIDIDPVKIEYARNNARIYGVEDRITFVVADFMDIAPALKGDIVFLSPPWGGPQYSKVDVFDMRTMIPMDGLKLFQIASDISPNIAYYLPRNVDREQVARLAGPGMAVEIEENNSGGHIVALTAYYGELTANIEEDLELPQMYF